MGETVESVAPAHLAEPATLRREPGQLVAGRYRIEQQLAEGGMGVVFRARDERSGTEVALKQLRVLPGLAQDVLAAIGVQFEREYHTLSQLSHPCIIRVFDYGVDEGGAYYTMELLQGQDLRQRGKLHWRDACPVLRDVASSLAILHSRRLLHRDVTARNVFCSEGGGRSKLIDFGAMMTMGVAKHLVGTPPFVPPEALQQQSLDGRSDLYSLGALSYWVLTGTYAYSARSLGELKERFATAPPTLRQHDPEIPEALDALVMSLLQLDRAARPGSAAEVMERLSGIAGLALEELPEVGRAYLSMPMLVGRDDSLERVAIELLNARQSKGSSILIEGPAGSGRSRMLDAGVMGAKLRGAVVLRGDAADGARGPYGVARALAVQMLEALPSETLQAARPQRDTLAQVLPELLPRGTEGAAMRPAHNAQRHQLQAALRDFFLAVARDKHVVIAVDDIERIDEPSAAMLGAMALAARRRRLNMLLTIGAGAPQTAALALLRRESTALPIALLSPAETEQLLGSVFGDVPHVAALAERIHPIAGGSPSATMMLAEHLVTQGIARYEAGSWALPEQLLADHLPSSTGEALLSRLAALSPDARDLVEVLALTETELIAPELYPRLSAHKEPGRTYRALEALTASGMLAQVGDRYRFAQFDASPTIERQLDPERARTLHARLAEALQDSERAERVPHHLLLGGQERAAIERILAQAARSSSFGLDGPQMLERAFEAAERLGFPLRTRLELRCVMLQMAAQMGQYERFLLHADLPVKQLELDSGLLDYARLSDELMPAVRLEEALRRAAERYEATAPDERGFARGELPINLFRVYSAFSSMSSIAQDLELLERLPNLEPLVGLSPLVHWAHSLLQVQISHRAGRSAEALRRAAALADELTGPANDGGSIAFIARSLRTAMLYMRSLFAATGGQSDTREHVRELEQLSGQRGNAWRVRMIYELMHGDTEAAAECQRRSELLNLQDGGQVQLPGTTVRTELIAFMNSDDLIGVKRVTERVAELAEVYPAWRPTLAVARCHYRRLQGDPTGGLAELGPALQIPIGRHMDWWLIAYTHVRVLSELDRAEEAARLGEGYVQMWTRQQESSPVDYGLRQAAADAMLRAGRVQDALKTIDEYIDLHQRAGTRGLRLGLAYETRARIAIAMRDEPSVQHYARLCAQQYKGGRHLMLLNRYARLLREADAGGIALTTGLRFGGDAPAATMMHTHTAHTVQSRLQACSDASERVEAALRVLLEASGAEVGFMFGLRGRELVQLAPVEVSAPNGMREWLEALLRKELENEVSTTIHSGVPEETGESRMRDESGREFESVLLSGKYKDADAVAGIAAIQYQSTRRPTMRRGVIEALTEILIADGIVDPVSQ